MVTPRGMAAPARGEVWWFDPDPVRGTELGHRVRPAVVVSVDAFNQGGPKVVVVPGTSRQHPNNPFHIPFTYRYQGQQLTTYWCCDNVRAVDVRERLTRRASPNPVPPRILGQIEAHLRTILGL